MREKGDKFCSSDWWEKKQTSTILTNDGMPRSFQVKKTCLYVMIVKSYLKIWVHFLALGSIFLLTLHCDNSFRIPVDIFKNWWWHKMFLKNIYISFCRVFISAKRTYGLGIARNWCQKWKWFLTISKNATSSWQFPAYYM